MNLVPDQKPRCKVCRVNYRVAKERCDTCYRYWRRTGHDRVNATEKQIRANKEAPSKAHRKWKQLERLLNSG